MVTTVGKQAVRILLGMHSCLVNFFNLVIYRSQLKKRLEFQESRSVIEINMIFSYLNRSMTKEM